MRLGITRVRNEGEIIKSTLDRLSYHLDGVVVYDDCSDDLTVEICQSHDLVLHVVRNPNEWSPLPSVRKRLETEQRQQLHDKARQLFKPEWMLYFDGDEHFYFDEIDWSYKGT